LKAAACPSAGLWKKLKANGWNPVVLGCDGKAILLEQRFVRGKRQFLGEAGSFPS
jgi:hypothetical protein